MGVRRSAGLIAATASVVVGLSVVTPASAATVSSDWPQYMTNTFHTSAGHQGALTPAAVATLHPAWHLTAAGTVDASVSVVGTRAYVVGRNAVVYALDAATGTVDWQRQLDKGSSAVCPAKGALGTPAVVPDPVSGALTVYAAGAHKLYALDAATGTQLWSRTIGPATASGNALYFNWASPTVSGGRIFLGLAANCEAHLIRGGLVSVNQHTGALLHTYYDTAAGTVGGSIWSSAASDGTSVWVTTGNPDPNGSAIHHSYSVVRLSAATLVEQDWWTVPESQTADLDSAARRSCFPPRSAAPRRSSSRRATRTASSTPGGARTSRSAPSGAGPSGRPATRPRPASAPRPSTRRPSMSLPGAPRSTG